MKARKVWQFLPMMAFLAAVIILFALISLLWDYRVGLAELAAGFIAVGALAIRFRSIQKDIRSIVAYTAGHLNASDRQALLNFPLPLVITSGTGEITWYNDRFRDSVVGGVDCFGKDIHAVARNLNPGAFDKPDTAVDVAVRNRRYTVVGSPSPGGFYLLYWIDNTELKRLVDEYHASRPVVAIVMIDNYDELMQNAREGEKAEVISQIEKALISWSGRSNGFLRQCDRDKYLFVFEERHLSRIVESRFDILDTVRQIVAGGRMPATLSIGVGRGAASMAQAEEMARQSLDMALGRGGDQAAICSPSGFEFYGGVSKAVEKRTKVKTRIIASALAELIDGSENVLIMGHRNSDLDSLGAAVGIYRAVVSRGKPARIVMDVRNSLARAYIGQLMNEGYGDAFVHPNDSLALLSRRTLLIIVDTHRKGFIEYPELYQNSRTVVVIDHHRKMVDFIDNAVIFYHEPYASSASEMVAELVQYLGDSAITPVEACAMLAGMTLDTRNFAVRTGVRTFEAAAYLRRKGADTAVVQQLFASSMDDYRKRTRLVSSAESFMGCAIGAYTGEPDADIKIIAPQAADDLLTITGVEASFVLYPDGGQIAISARSMGRVNVQLVMESLGGGGHQSMAGAQLKIGSMAEAVARVKAALEKYRRENS